MYSEKKKHLSPRTGPFICCREAGTDAPFRKVRASPDLYFKRELRPSCAFPESTISFSYSINQLIESCIFSFSSHLFWSKNYAKSKERDLLLE